MDLNTFLSQSDSTALSFAKKLGVSSVLISQWKTGKRPVPIERCTAIEVATGGQVTRKDLRPDDWESIWPELKTDEAA
jgi:DNA-binding transcriptional regulator YdaS (Cro superfamily)